ncbi:hypothetical protein E2C01_020157 [Portunus trituberculatus]|uniref:Uncharacterized protein n=1 Tax=Portunus trituberculatus TaxID=210409 RepID=A0A5B7E0J9_PORTR|nr:hypothetical protein [Portunus trituberculatus]
MAWVMNESGVGRVGDEWARERPAYASPTHALYSLPPSLLACLPPTPLSSTTRVVLVMKGISTSTPSLRLILVASRRHRRISQPRIPRGRSLGRVPRLS